MSQQLQRAGISGLGYRIIPRKLLRCASLRALEC